MLPRRIPMVPGECRTVLLACQAMGTRFEFALWGSDEVRLRAAGEAAVEEILHWHRRLSWFDRGSFVSHVNRHAGAGAVACDREFFCLPLLCRAVWGDSGGAFDPTVAALLRASGFRGTPRDGAAIGRALLQTGFGAVELDEARLTVRFSRPGIGLDLGAVGKGWALDRARDVLAESGVTSGLLHGGTSSVLAIGAPPDEDSWPIAVGRRPDAPVLHLCDGALGVSGGHGRVIEENGNSYGHVLDPRTGRSAVSGGLAAVIAESAALADAWSTALLVAPDLLTDLPTGLTGVLAPAAPDPSGWRIRGPHESDLSFPEYPHAPARTAFARLHS